MNEHKSMGEMSRFQIILLALFVFFIIGGVLAFSLYQGSKQNAHPQVVLWGTLSEQMFRTMFDSGEYRSSGLNVFYVEKDAVTFDRDFVNALAEGKGPDLVLMPQDLIQKEKNKLGLIPFETYSERSYKDSFVEGTEIFIESGGVSAIPFTVDPLVMYWNRNLFQNAGVSVPPKQWDEFFALASKLSEKDSAGNVRKSVAPLGGFSNVRNAKELISLLLMQSGSSIVIVGSQGGLEVDLNNSKQVGGQSGAEQALTFYTTFTDPTSPNHSWSRALPESQNAFIGGNLATYFGFASELPSIRAKNPNLNFDITTVPQLKGSNVKMTYGRFSAFAIPLQAKNGGEAILVAQTFTSTPFVARFTEITGLPPVRRDLLSIPPTDSYKQVFYGSALISRSWRDPNGLESNNIFSSMIDDINSGREGVGSALSNASAQLQQLLRSSNN